MDPRYKRLLYQSTHRGGKELDIILGNFAQTQLSTLTASEVDHLETLLALDEGELWRIFLEGQDALIPPPLAPLVGRIKASLPSLPR